MVPFQATTDLAATLYPAWGVTLLQQWGGNPIITDQPGPLLISPGATLTPWVTLAWGDNTAVSQPILPLMGTGATLLPWAAPG